MVNRMDDDISREINLIMKMVPKKIFDTKTNEQRDLTDLEKIRWVYIKLGDLFCYDYRILEDINVVFKKFSYDPEKQEFLYVDKYETCAQIAEILTIVINHLNLKAKAKTITRQVERRGNYANIVDTGGHKAVEVALNDEYNIKILLDLTLDLYLIQSGCQTKEFGYTTDMYNTYEIISTTDVSEIDKELRLIKGFKYTDESIQTLANELSQISYKNADLDKILEYKISEIAKKLQFPFTGSHEGKRYILKIFQDILSPREYAQCREYNLSFKKNDNLQMITCFVFEGKEKIICYIFDNKLGLMQTSPEVILELLNSGWKTNSLTLEKRLLNYLTNKNQPKNIK